MYTHEKYIYNFIINSTTLIIAIYTHENIEEIFYIQKKIID